MLFPADDRDSPRVSVMWPLATSITFCCPRMLAVRRFEDFNSRLAEDLSLASDTDGLIAGTLACSNLNALHLMRTYGWPSWWGEIERWLGRDLGYCSV